MSQRFLSCVKQNLDFINILFDHELAIAELANRSTLALSIGPDWRAWINPRLLHTLCIVWVAAESAEDHLFRVLKGIMARWALRDFILFIDGPSSRKYGVIVLVFGIVLSQLEVLTLFCQVLLKLREDLLRVVIILHLLCLIDDWTVAEIWD